MVRRLGEPGAIESLTRRGRASETEETGKAKPPLVVQAEAFALYLNPPQPPKRTPPPPRARVTRVEVAPVAAESETVRDGVRYFFRALTRLGVSV